MNNIDKVIVEAANRILSPEGRDIETISFVAFFIDLIVAANKQQNLEGIDDEYDHISNETLSRILFEAGIKCGTSHNKEQNDNGKELLENWLEDNHSFYIENNKIQHLCVRDIQDQKTREAEIIRHNAFCADREAKILDDLKKDNAYKEVLKLKQKV